MDSSDEADPTFDESAAKLVGLFEASKTWTVHEMLIDVATSSNNDTPRLLNLTTTFSCNQKEPSPHQIPSQHHYLPQSYNQNTQEFRKKTLIPYFVRAAQQSGFTLICKGWEKSKNALRFQCHRSIPYRSNNSQLVQSLSPVKKRLWKKPQQDQDKSDFDDVPPKPNFKDHLKFNPSIGSFVDERTPRTIKAYFPRSNDELCPFRFYIKWDPLPLRWYIPATQNGCPNHIGHLHRATHKVRMRSAAIGPTAEQMKKDAVLSEIRSRSISNLITRTTGVTLETYQINKAKRQIKFKELVIHAEVVFGESIKIEDGYKPSHADMLLLKLQKEDYSYTAIFADYSTSDLKIRFKRRNKKSNKVENGDKVDMLLVLGGLVVVLLSIKKVFFGHGQQQQQKMTGSCPIHPATTLPYSTQRTNERTSVRRTSTYVRTESTYVRSYDHTVRTSLYVVGSYDG